MSVNDGSVTRQFVASSPSMAATMNELVTGKRKSVFYVLYSVVAAAVFVVTMVRPLKPWMMWGLIGVIAAGVVASLAWPAYVWLRSRRKVLIDVTSGGLTVSQQSGAVFSIAEAQLGPWVTMGVALHLQSGPHRFVLGGRDRRIAASTRLDAAPVPIVDAWLWASEFDELLAMAGRRGGPALNESTTCLLFPNPRLGEEFGSFGFRKHLQLERSLSRPSLVLEVDNDAMRVIDPESNALTASASVAQVTATPTTFQPDSATSGDGSTYDYPAITGLVVSLPGEQPLTIGCLDLEGLEFRFSWRIKVRGPVDRPAYVVSGGDLLMLAERFGLTAQLDDHVLS